LPEDIAMTKRGLTLRVVMLVVAADIIQFVIMVSFKNVAAELPPVSLDALRVGDVLHLAWLAVQTKYFWFGIAGMVSSFIIWPAVLSALDLSVAFPLGSMSFVLIPILSIVFLGEHISALRWFGIFVITAGIAWLSVTEKQPALQAAEAKGIT
jgi:drug/metabolite transporter (DMT)-like permease